jgi:hypothetical protein
VLEQGLDSIQGPVHLKRHGKIMEGQREGGNGTGERREGENGNSGREEGRRWTAGEGECIPI